MSSSDLDSLMRRADMARKEDREAGMDAPDTAKDLDLANEWIERLQLEVRRAQDEICALHEAINGPGRSASPPLSEGRVYNERWLQEQIEQTWGEHGAHAEVFGDILKKLGGFEA